MNRLRSTVYFLLLFYGSGASAEIADYPFSIRAQGRTNGPSLVAHNDGPATITFSLRLEGSNIERHGELILHSVRPYTRQTVARIRPIDRTQGYRYGYRSSVSFGGLDVAGGERQVERFPWNLHRARVGQAPGGTMLTHTTLDSRNAIDFTLPEGTPILAAKAGVVVDVIAHHTRGGQDSALIRDANAVLIEHEDGTLGSYGHLAYGNTYAYRGRRVQAGDIVGLSGNTGYSFGPHLHFSISKTVALTDGRVEHESLPIRFKTPDQGFIFLRQGDTIDVSGTRVQHTSSHGSRLGADDGAAETAINPPVDLWSEASRFKEEAALDDGSLLRPKWAAYAGLIAALVFLWRLLRK